MQTHLRLTDEQLHAATGLGRFTFIEASPGSGKTTVAAERFGVQRYLDGDPGRGIRAVSFTRSATRELDGRVARRWGATAARWPNRVTTLDSMHWELVSYLLKGGHVRWPAGHTEIEVLDVWRGQSGSHYLTTGNGYRRVATLSGAAVVSRAERIARSLLSTCEPQSGECSLTRCSMPINLTSG